MAVFGNFILINQANRLFMEPMVVIAARAAEKVGKEILYAHQNRHKIELDTESKGLDGLVTRIDRFSEELTIATLKASYPDHSFLGEEFGMKQGRGDDADWCWIIDPLDGTQNFVHGVPQFCVSIAVQYKGVTEHGVVYDPVRDEMFSASRGKGARLNQRRINVTDRNRNGEVVSYAKQHFESLQKVCEAGGQIRRLGSAALDLCYVAAGRFDGYFEMSIKPWDIAAGELIVTEARGTVVDHTGAHNSMTSGSIFACNIKLLKPLMQTVVPCWGEAV